MAKKYSPKQLAYLWINGCLEPEKINPELEDFERFTNQEISEKELQETNKFIFDTLQKIKKDRFEDYIQKYCSPFGVGDTPSQ